MASSKSHQRLVMLAELLMRISQMGQEHAQIVSVIARQATELRNRRRQGFNDFRVPPALRERFGEREVPQGLCSCTAITRRAAASAPGRSPNRRSAWDNRYSARASLRVETMSLSASRALLTSSRSPVLRSA